MNLNDPKRRGQPQLIILLLIVAGILVLMDSRGMLSGVLGNVQGPLIGLTQRFSGLNDNLRQPTDMAAARAEIDALKARVEQLEQENSQLRVVETEYIRVRQLLEIQQAAPNISTVVGQVIGKGPNPAFRDLIIDIGSEDGVLVGMPVRSSRGLVGQIFRTTANSSQVVLITDASVSVPVRLSQSRAPGIVRGGAVGGLLTLEYVSLEAQLSPNEVILTAGVQGSSPQEVIANRYPRDLVVGRIIDVERSDAALFQQGTIQPDVDFETLETVFVITGFEEIDASIFGDQP